MNGTPGAGTAPRTAVLEHVGDLLDREADAVLVTVVGVRGSAYRRPGAKMVVADGDAVGSVANRCLEAAVRRLAAEVADAGTARVETFDQRAADEGAWGPGTGCDGRVDVLVEPLDGSYRPAVEAFDRGEDAAVVTVLDSDRVDVTRRDRAHYRPGTGFEPAGGLPDAVLEPVEEAAAHLAREGGGDAVTVGTTAGDVTLFVDGIAAPPELVVLGSGPDVGPVVGAAKRNGFRVTVVGFRGAVALDERFPAADATVTTSPAALADHCEFDGDTYAVVMTHNLVDDRMALETLLGTEVPYVGLMGPRERFEKVVAAFREQGKAPTRGDLERVYAPVGLDLGGGDPNQVATSIVAEVLAVHRDRDPGHLADRDGPVHGRVEVPGADGGGPG